MQGNPTPPCIDVFLFEDDPIERIAMGSVYAFDFTVRVRVTDADEQGGQSLLLSMMDPNAVTSLTEAVEGTYAIGGTTYDVSVEAGPSGLRAFNNPDSVDSRLLGATWLVRVL